PMESLEPVPAAVAVARAAPVKSSRSPVATMADLAPLLSGLCPREALPVCPEHGAPGVQRTASSWARPHASPHRSRAIVTYEQPVRGAEDYLRVRDVLARQGYTRLWLQDTLRSIEQVPPSEVSEQEAVHVVIDRVSLHATEEARLAEGLQQALSLGAGRAA